MDEMMPPAEAAAHLAANTGLVREAPLWLVWRWRGQWQGIAGAHSYPVAIRIAKRGDVVLPRGEHPNDHGHEHEHGRRAG